MRILWGCERCFFSRKKKRILEAELTSKEINPLKEVEINDKFLPKKSVLKIEIEEIDSQTKLDKFIENDGHNCNVKQMTYFEENNYYYFKWYETSLFAEWATFVCEIKNDGIINFYTVSLQGEFEQEGAYKIAERNAFNFVIKPFLNSRFPKISGELKLLLNTYTLD